jgi:uncharacterized protein with HEPN domain
MSERADRDFVSDIQEALRRIATYTAGMTEEAFMADVKTQDAVIRNLEILGEATKNLSEEFRARYSHIPWKNMAGVRDRLIHHYFGINLDIVWQIVVAELPDVITALDEVVDDDTV